LKNNQKNGGSFPPWSRVTSLQELANDAGIDFEEFIACLDKGYSTSDIAKKFSISESAAESLEQYFYHYGVGSIIGGD